jgi:hypothetical protein
MSIEVRVLWTTLYNTRPSTCTEIQNGRPSDIQEVMQNPGFRPTDGGNALVFSQRVRRLRGYVRGVVLQGLVEMVAEVELRMVVLKGQYPI